MKIPGINAAYEAIQYHVHSASEQSLDGEYFCAEQHIVHRDVGGGRLAVLGIFLDGGFPTNNPTFEAALEKWNEAQTNVLESCNRTVTRRQLQINQEYNIYDLVPPDSTYYQYTGSLTTPPCSEVVDWNVVSKKAMILVKQYTDLLDIIYGVINPATCEDFSILNKYGSSSRPVQTLNGRKVCRICARLTRPRKDLKV